LAACGPLGNPIRGITRGEFAAFQRLIRDEAGIFLSDVKKALLVGRLTRRLRDLGLTTFGAYLDRVREDEAERVRMVDSICTNETQFFREPRQFAFLEERLIPAWTSAAAAGRRPRQVRAWSAACSTGEEPYSLAMVLLHHLPPAAGWQVEILASDLSTRALERAAPALWPIDRSLHIPVRYLKQFMLRRVGPEEGRMAAGNAIRSAVRFQRLNLVDDSCALEAGFDVVFCRNVLIYFRAETKAHVLRRLVRCLAPGGHLFLGHAECVTGLVCGLCNVGPNVYTRGEDGAGRFSRDVGAPRWRQREPRTGSSTSWSSTTRRFCARHSARSWRTRGA
jgi:chemotaxis protein methyltransferase CheR